jgi:hypothetical protein
MQEREYFRQICLMVLHRNKQVVFAAVIDKYGKLLSGQRATKYDSEDNKRGRACKPTINISCYESNNIACHFFNNCLVPVIKLDNNASKHTADIARKELIPLYDMISPGNRFVTIGITPITESRDRFLYIYTGYRDIETEILI